MPENGVTNAPRNIKTASPPPRVPSRREVIQLLNSYLASEQVELEDSLPELKASKQENIKELKKLKQRLNGEGAPIDTSTAFKLLKL